MIARTLVGSVLHVGRRTLGERRSELLDEQRVALRRRATALARAAVVIGLLEQQLGELAARSSVEPVERERRVGREAAAPARAVRSAAPAARARGGAPAPRARASRASRAGRAGSRRPSGCPRTGAPSAPASRAPRRRRVPRRTASRGRRRLRRPRARGGSRGVGACSAPSGEPTSSAIGPCSFAAPPRARRCRIRGDLLDVMTERAVRGCSLRTASSAHGWLGRLWQRRAARTRARGVTFRCRPGRRPSRDAVAAPPSHAPRCRSGRRALGRGRPWARRWSPARRSPRAARRRARQRTGVTFPCDDGRRGPVLDRPAGACVGLLADEDRAHGRRGLESCGRVDDVSRDHRLALLGPRIERDDRLARVDRYAELETFVRSPSRAPRSAARTARSGSSPCVIGAPKTPMTASPMNFSTVPPKSSI